jgi:signal transduction histidine kinase
MKKSKILEILMIPCVYDENNSVAFYINNITHYRKIKVLEALNSNKERMLAQVAHELRTPLNCIISML